MGRRTFSLKEIELFQPDDTELCVQVAAYENYQKRMQWWRDYDWHQALISVCNRLPRPFDNGFIYRRYAPDLKEVEHESYNNYLRRMRKDEQRSPEAREAIRQGGAWEDLDQAKNSIRSKMNYARTFKPSEVELPWPDGAEASFDKRKLVEMPIRDDKQLALVIKIFVPAAA